MNKKISTLPSADAIDGSELVPIVQSGATKQTTISELRPYKIYSALLTQSGTDAPTAIVLENTIGEIVWSRVAVGGYVATLTNAFTLNKTFLLVNNSNNVTDGILYSLGYDSIDTIYFTSYNISSLNNEDSLCNNVSIEIRVYN